jgi:hypothetical protein
MASPDPSPAADKPMIDRENRPAGRRLRAIRARTFDFRSFARAARAIGPAGACAQAARSGPRATLPALGPAFGAGV